jgi:hypothetical protein
MRNFPTGASEMLRVGEFIGPTANLQSPENPDKSRAKEGGRRPFRDDDRGFLPPENECQLPHRRQGVNH